MPSTLTVGIAQTSTHPTKSATLSSLHNLAKAASSKSISILLFPEAYLGGYPRTCTFGSTIGSRTAQGRDQFLQYQKSAIDLGDTFRGEEEAWLSRQLPVDPTTGHRGDGTREALEQTARVTGVFLIVGVVEKAGSSLFCAAVYVHPTQGIIGKRRKVMPTSTERLVWSQGAPATLKAIATTVAGVKLVMGTAICWENYMPLLRYAIYSQGVNLWLAPTADARATWESLMKTIALEGRCFVLSANQCLRVSDLPEWIAPSAASSSASADVTSEWACRGGSCIVAPTGESVVAPCWEKMDEILYAEIDIEDCERGKLDFDVVGHYSRHDAFELRVEGLELRAPP